MEPVQRLVAAVWFGSAVFLMIASSAAFRAAGNTTTAANVVGSMLTRWHYIALAAPLVLFALELRRVRRGILIILFISILLAAIQSFVDLRIRSIRDSSYVPISELRREDPVRRMFGALHGISMTLLLMQAIAGAAVVAARTKPAERVVVAPAAVAPTPAQPVPPAAPEPRPDVVSNPDETSGGGP